MLQTKKKQTLFEDSGRVANLCRMLRHRPKTTVTPSKIISMKNNINQINANSKPLHNQDSLNKENQEQNKNHRRSSTHLERYETKQSNKRTWQETSQSAIQKNNCKIHPNKEAPYELEIYGGCEYYCDRCAIQLTNQGHRLVQSSQQSRLKKCLQECMNVQISVVQRAYRQVIARLENDLEALENQIRKSYEAELKQQHIGSKLQVLLFKPNHLNTDIFNRIKQMIGLTNVKTVNLSAKQFMPKESHRQHSSLLSESEGVRPFSCRSKAIPTEIMIELCNQDLPNEVKLAPNKTQSMLRHEIENYLKH